MTIDERIERLEHITAAHIEQAKKDYEENRRLWREHQTDIEAIWKRMDRGFEEMRSEMRSGFERSRQFFDRGMAEMRREMAARDEIMDRRIGALVSAIGKLVEGKS